MNRQGSQLARHFRITAASLLFGSALGALIGYCVYVQQRPLYKATAQIEVLSLTSHLPRPVINGLVDTRSRGDEIVVVRSLKVLRKAIELGGLAQHPKLAGQSAEDILRWLRDPHKKVLEVRMASITKYSDIITKYSDIINISATTEDPELSGDVVHAIVDSYDIFLRENRNPSDVLAHLNFLLSQFEEAKLSAGPDYLKTIKSIEVILTDKIRRLSSSSDANQIARLEIPTICSFAGPYLSSHVGTGALIGFLTTGALVLLFTLANASPKHRFVHT